MSLTQQLTEKRAALHHAEKRAKAPSTDPRDASAACERADRLIAELEVLQERVKEQARLIDLANALAKAIADAPGGSRERSTATTKAEEAAMWLQKELG